MFSANVFEGIQALNEPSMGTEVLAQLLYSIVRFTRPARLLEIGAGYTTIPILQALADNVRDYEVEKGLVVRATASGAARPPGLLLSEYYDGPYCPTLLSIDDLSAEKSTAPLVPEVAKSLGLSQFLQFRIGDFASVLSDVKDEIGQIDFAWLDCGSYDNYKAFTELVWPIMNKDGGLVVFHSTETNFEAQAFIRKMKIRQATTAFNDFELCGLLEPHKRRQNSVAIFRITSGLQDRFYSNRS